jgi:hypothetical protein
MASEDSRVVMSWVRKMEVKREQVRRCRKDNLRLVAILNNGIEQNRILYRELREKLREERRQREPRVGAEGGKKAEGAEGRS